MNRTLLVVASVAVPELAAAASWAAPPDAAAPLGTQFLISVALMGIAGAFVAWDGLTVARERRRLRAARAATLAGGD